MISSMRYELQQQGISYKKYVVVVVFVVVVVVVVVAVVVVDMPKE